MEAESRDAVFVALRQRGIKAIKVVAADGSKANGEVRGVRKRVVVAAVFGAAVVTAILTVIIRSTPTPLATRHRRVTRSTAIPSSSRRSSAATLTRF